ncbi:hypothetical protein WR25_00435 [Diploscapter pachys]|uniref:VPS9 domain-containing protein n=1 Tax=Diploscapter pachys TaxID=2018661 RepID=A0A2A2KY11_9BILA|nr:hypothetical protein WR25_00435 [Diploscapter pachys]
MADWKIRCNSRRGREREEEKFLSDRNSRNPTAQPQIQSGVVPTPQSQQKESELVWRRAKNQSNFPVKPGHTTANGNQPHQRGSLYIPSPVSPKLPTGQNNVWNAVNSELKNRQQKIAKVRPTLQPRSNSNSTRPSIGSAKMPLESNGETAIMQPGVSGSSNREHRRSSDYAQLSDFATVEIGTARQSNRGRDDDAVSVAGTVFEEPWDSSAWENLLDLANHGDDTHAIREPIQEEDSDSDRTAGDSTRMHESDDEEEYLDGMWNGASGNGRRTLPSDRVTQKAWEREDKQNGAAIDVNSRYSTLDSRMDDSFNGSLTRQKHGRASPPYSLNSLPRPLSRFSQHQVGSIDDLPTALPSLSPILKGEKPRQTEPIGRSIQAYVEQLASLTEGPSACFGMTLRQFITCTKETKETEAQAVYRNVRQFMNGMKNYLVKHGEGKLHDIIEEESSRLSANQFLNIDAVLESVLHKLLIKEVKSLLYYTLVNSMARTGELKRLSHGLNAIRPIELNKYGFTNEQNLVVPSAAVMDQVKQYLRKMQHHYSPIKKLENLLKVIGLVLCCQKDINYELTVTGSRIPSRNDLVRWLVYIFTRTQTMCCEIEAYYMWELLPQQIYMQDSFYYLHALYTAISILKSDKLYLLDENGRPGFASIDFNIQWHNPSAMSGVHDVFITVAIPDEITGCIRYATMPNVPHMNTARLNRIIAHQHGITNPDDYGLYLIVNGFENLLSPTECPDVIRDRLRKNLNHFDDYSHEEYSFNFKIFILDQ